MKRINFLVAGLLLCAFGMFFAPEVEAAEVTDAVDAPGVETETVEASRPVPAKQWNDKTKLWIARSCVGESGWSPEECYGIAWVYATRAEQLNVHVRVVARQYSAAIKDHSASKLWIRNLTLTGKRPNGWPDRLKWSNHKQKWLDLLACLDRWAEGEVENPVLGANHYGGKMDIPGKRWTRIPAPLFRNRFWRSEDVQGKTVAVNSTR